MDLQSARAFFGEKFVKISDEWLQQCLEFVIDENFGGSAPRDARNLHDSLYEQWLLADLHEIGLSTLPQCISKANKFILNGNFALQVNSIFDASRSAFSQYQKITGAENENANVTGGFDEEPKFWEKNGKRMLILELTDGVTTFRAMEYEPVKDLKLDLEPGCKILLKGRITCKRGMALLQNENVKILGGNVERLLTLNNQENFLKRKIEEAKNYRSTNLETTVNDNRTTRSPAIAPTVNNDQRRSITAYDNFPDENDSGDIVATTVSDNRRNFATVNPNIRPSTSGLFDSDDEFSVEQRQTTVMSTRPENTNHTTVNRRSDIPDDDDFPMGDYSTVSAGNRYSIPEDDDLQVRNGNYMNARATVTQAPKINNRYDIPDDDGDDFFIESPTIVAGQQHRTIESPPTPPPATLMVSSGQGVELHYDEGGRGFFLKAPPGQQRPQMTPGLKLARIFDLTNQIPTNTSFVTVKGTVIQIVQRLNVVNNRWFCVVKISDGTGCLDCEICDQVLTSLLSMTSSEALAIRACALQSPKQKAAQNVKIATNFLRNFDGLIHLEIDRKLSLPIIQRFELIDRQKSQMLQKFYYCNIKNVVKLQ